MLCMLKALTCMAKTSPVGVWCAERIQNLYLRWNWISQIVVITLQIWDGKYHWLIHYGRWDVRSNENLHDEIVPYQFFLLKNGRYGIAFLGHILRDSILQWENVKNEVSADETNWNDANENERNKVTKWSILHKQTVFGWCYKCCLHCKGKHKYDKQRLNPNFIYVIEQ